MTLQKIKELYNDSIHSKVIDIMRTTNKPMSVEEITEKILQRYAILGHTPQNTISAILQRSFYVQRISRGIYQIR